MSEVREWTIPVEIITDRLITPANQDVPFKNIHPVKVIEKSAYDSLSQQLEQARAECEKWKNNYYEAVSWRDRLRAQRDLLRESILIRGAKYHDDDCADQKENFSQDEVCECGAVAVRQALKACEASET